MVKDKIRLNLTQLREKITKSDLKTKNMIIKSKVLELVHDIEVVGIYVSKGNEVDTIEIIKELLKTKVVCVPKVENNIIQFHVISSFNDLEKGFFNVLEPKNDSYIDIDKIQVMIVPIVGFDLKCNRLGYGKGFYDKALAKYDNQKIGLGYIEQKVEDLKPLNHDIAMDLIICDELIIRRKRLDDN